MSGWGPAAGSWDTPSSSASTTPKTMSAPESAPPSPFKRVVFGNHHNNTAMPDQNSTASTDTISVNGVKYVKVDTVQAETTTAKLDPVLLGKILKESGLLSGCDVKIKPRINSAIHAVQNLEIGESEKKSQNNINGGWDVSSIAGDNLESNGGNWNTTDDWASWNNIDLIFHEPIVTVVIDANERSVGYSIHLCIARQLLRDSYHATCLVDCTEEPVLVRHKLPGFRNLIHFLYAREFRNSTSHVITQFEHKFADSYELLNVYEAATYFNLGNDVKDEILSFLRVDGDASDFISLMQTAYKLIGPDEVLRGFFRKNFGKIFESTFKRALANGELQRGRNILSGMAQLCNTGGDFAEDLMGAMLQGYTDAINKHSVWNDLLHS